MNGINKALTGLYLGNVETSQELSRNSQGPASSHLTWPLQQLLEWKLPSCKSGWTDLTSFQKLIQSAGKFPVQPSNGKWIDKSL